MNIIIYTLALTTAQNLELPPLVPIPPIPRANCNGPECQNVISTKETPPYSPNDILYIRLQAQSIRNAIKTTPENKKILTYALTSTDSRIKAAACSIAAEYGSEYIDDIIENLADTNIIVQQAARQASIGIASRVTGIKNSIDFGPMITDNGAQVTASQTMWKLWFTALSPAQRSKITVDKKDTTPVTTRLEKK